APGHSFSDVARKVVSIINLASLAAVETAVGVPVDPLRFRANLYVTGWPAWREFDLHGQEIAIGKDARLRVVKRIVRCAATNVDPVTAIRDLEIPATLLRTFGHADCGVYGEVVTAGEHSLGVGMRPPRPTCRRMRQWPKLGNDTTAWRPMRSMCSSTTRGCRVACSVCERITKSKA